MPLSSAEAFAPATIANIGVGFDILGMAVEDIGDTVFAQLTETPGVVIESITGDGGRLPLKAEKNTAGVAAIEVLKRAGSPFGVSLRIHKGLPLASGLGSSAASAVAGAVATNAALGNPLTRDELLAPALEGEALVSGYHADNVAPALYGGITLSYGVTAGQIVRLPSVASMYLSLVTPNVEVETAKARAALPAQVPLKSMVAQTAGVARLMHGIYTGDIAMIAAAMETDTIIEPARAFLMPLLAEARSTAKQHGALALVISGAGPTLVAVSDNAQTAGDVCKALQALYDQAGIGGVTRTSRILDSGAYVTL
ncbi:MAG: homoserine kinase [Pleurocapsa minor GSE-CHR-MK-17-07R]|jgi:homoserine kinase|nr:homoserine kinase [Pleurocapsa minor GSE-CHR-MK 17-07R]